MTSQVKISHVVCDECHTILDWGLDDMGTRPAFRPAFLAVRELKTHVSGALMMGLTATAKPEDIQSLKTYLALNDPFVITRSPDR